MEKRVFPNRLREWHTNWPIRRTLLFGSVAAFVASLGAVFLPLWAVAIPLLGLALVILLPRLRRPHLLLFCGIAACFWLGGVGYRAVRVQPLQSLSGQTDTLSGWVEVAPSHSNLYTLRVTESRLLPPGTRVLLYCTDVCAPTAEETLTATVRLAAVDPQQTSFLADGIFLLAFPTAYGEEAVTITGKADRFPFLYRMQAMRRPLHRILRQQLPGDEGALLAALCLGEQQALSTELQQAYRDSGLSHVLVVSGLHLSMVTLAVRTLFRQFRLSKRLASLLTVPVLIAFALLIGLTPSVVRAGVMCLMWLLGQVLRQRADGLNSLGLAALFLLLTNPYMAVDPGYLLSFSATAGVLCLTGRLSPSPPRFDGDRLRYAKRKLTHRVVVTLVTSLCAYLFLIPLLCHYFGGFPLITPLSNLLAVPPATAALLVGWAGMLLCVLPGGFVFGKPLLLLAGLLARLATKAAGLCGSVPGWVPVSNLWQFLLVCGGCGLLAAGIYARSRLVWRSVLVITLFFSLFVGGLTTYVKHHSLSLTAVSAGSGVAVLLQEGLYTALLVTHSDGIDQAACLLEEAGCPALNHLFIGKSDPAHAGCLAALVRQTPTDQILAPGGADWVTGLVTPLDPLELNTPFSASQAVWTADTPSAWRLTVCGTTYYFHSTDSCYAAVWTGEIPITLRLVSGKEPL